MANQDVSLRGLFCTVLTLARPGEYVATAPSIPAEHEGFSRLRVAKGAAFCSFPRMSADRKVTEGNVEVFVGQYVGVRSGNFLVITPLKGNQWQEAQTTLRDWS